jgi:hypothetical protein
MTGDILYNLCKRLQTKPDALIQYQSVGEVYTFLQTCTTVKQTQRGWIENIKNIR